MACLPVFLIAALGWGYAGRWRLPVAEVNAANIRVFLPFLVFSALVGAPLDWGNMGWIALYGGAIVLGSGLVSFAVCRFCGWQPRDVVPPMMFTNYGNMGLPLIPLAFGADALPAAVILFIVGNSLHLTLGFKIYSSALRWREIATSPMLVAAALGLACAALDIAPGGVFMLTIKMVGAVSIPLMLFTLGISLRAADMQMLRAGIAPALLCPASGLLCFALLWGVMPLPDSDKWIVCLFAALPPALLNYMFAENFSHAGINPTRVASIVIIGNLLSSVILPLTLLTIFTLQ